MYTDIQELRQTCPECQRVACHCKHKAPLMPLPVVDQPLGGDRLGRASPSNKSQPPLSVDHGGLWDSVS